MASRIVAVCGPPGGGKTFYVQREAQPGDLVLDMDMLFMALSGQPMYEKPKALLPFVCEARDAVLRRLSRPHSIRCAWLVQAAPDPATRLALRQTLGAELIVLATPVEECLRRIAADERRGPGIDWQPLVRDWWQRYRPLYFDTVIGDM